jgi:hypothetical protein
MELVFMQRSSKQFRETVAWKERSVFRDPAMNGEASFVRIRSWNTLRFFQATGKL